MKSRKTAFTLIELLVVIAIIAILAAILFPVFAQAKAAAKKTADLSNIKQISLGILSYTVDSDDVFPLSVYATGQPGFFGERNMFWPRATQPYIKSYAMFYDPSEKDNRGAWTASQPDHYKSRFPSYGYNADYLNNGGFNCDQIVDGDWGTGTPISTTSPAKPSETVMIVDGKVKKANSSEYADSPAIANDDKACWYWGDQGWGSNSHGDTYGYLSYTGGTSPRYNDGVQVGWVDGSAKYLKTGRLAQGTNWDKNKKPVITDIVITDRSKYLWDIE